MKYLRCMCLFPLLIMSACGQVISQDKSPGSSVEAAAMVDSLYKVVVARHPLGTPDRKVYGPYLSKGLLHSFDVEDACFARWRRTNPDPNLKLPVGLFEFGVFSGGSDGEPQTFRIEKVEPEKDGSYRAHVKLTHTEESYKQTWHVVVVVTLENGRPVVDDVIYPRQVDGDEIRLSEVLGLDCKGG